ncbi:ABC transporter substrate-binding protein [Actinomadura algeriensis]|uniref:ABC-type transport system substrate-binding protein n=1 Tax=Actinomadura algeriensis TaxID=1679523 RepID=A0ABR9K4L9_9ACTN|nr:ABC transporter substrate-binding protein [Actinomadura algeriensis]MBE1537789.1 ABC-type transport system substrate-binding protein [Actinomadura algeriensis]
MPEAAPLRTGDPEQLGPYRLTGLLGEGGQGAVYLGEDADGGAVAIKLLHARFSGDPKARSRFAAEVAVAKRVSPFCTAPVLDSDVEGDRPYIVSEFIDGPSLSAVLADEGPRRGTDLDRLAIGTMTALAAIHQAGVVHRDFKPGNVLLAPDGPRVIDFGIARALDATGTMSSVAVGTPAYMAPEQISGNQVGPAADVWSWGSTMAYAANGRPAFGQDSIPAVMNRILNLPPDLGGLQEPLRGLVLACLAKNPALRPASQQVLAHLLSLAGSLRRPGLAAAPGDAEMLTKGAETAAAESARLRAAPTPPPGSSAHPGASTPPGSAHPPARPGGLPALPAPGPVPQPRGVPGQPAALGWPGAHPLPAGPQPGRPGPGPAGGTWPGRPAGPPGSGGEFTEPSRRRRGRPRTRVLAGAGGAALVALVLVGTVILTRIGGDEGSDPPTGRTGGTLTMTAPDLLGSGDRIDPSHSLSGTERFLSKQLYTGLTAVGTDGRIRNMLATEIRPEESCREWHIVLRDGTKFSDGTPVDGEAFARGWARAAVAPEGAGPYLMSDIEGFDAVSSGDADAFSGVKTTPNGLSVRLTSPNCDFPARLADPVFAPLPPSAGEPDNEAFNRDPIGNGPFRVESYTPGKQAVLVRNESWAFGQTKLDRVEIRLVPDTAVSRALFQADDIGWGHLNGIDDLGSVSRDPSFVSRTVPFVRMLVPLTARGPMESPEARLAVSYALDRTALARLTGGIDQPAHGLVPRALPGFGEPGTCASCDAANVERAKQLAADADLGSGATVRLSYRTSTDEQKLAEGIKARLESVLGWKIELKATPVEDFTEFRDGLASDEASGLALFAWGPDYASPYTMLWPLLGGTLVATDDNEYYNLSGWENDRFDEVMGQAVRTTSGRERTDLYKQAEKMALDDMALIPLIDEARAALASEKYVHLEMDYDGDPTLATAALK